MKKYFDILEELRHSGRVNMCRATSCLQRYSPEVMKGPQGAREIQNGGGEQ